MLTKKISRFRHTSNYHLFSRLIRVRGTCVKYGIRSHAFASDCSAQNLWKYSFISTPTLHNDANAKKITSFRWGAKLWLVFSANSRQQHLRADSRSIPCVRICLQPPKPQEIQLHFSTQLFHDVQTIILLMYLSACASLFTCFVDSEAPWNVQTSIFVQYLWARATLFTCFVDSETLHDVQTTILLVSLSACATVFTCFVDSETPRNVQTVIFVQNL